jgi:hypothetical protein
VHGQESGPASSPRDERSPQAFPAAIVVGGLLLMAALIMAAFIWAADDGPRRSRSPVPNGPTAAAEAAGAPARA